MEEVVQVLFNTGLNQETRVSIVLKEMLQKIKFCMEYFVIRRNCKGAVNQGHYCTNFVNEWGRAKETCA
jgi:ribosomal protein S28E/S33